MLNNKCNFNYICLLDEDLKLLKFDIHKLENNHIQLNNTKDYDPMLNSFYIDYLQKYQHLIALPHRTDWGGYMNIPKVANVIFINNSFVAQRLIDPMIAFYFRSLINNELLFPIYSEFDTYCWWFSGKIQRFKIQMSFPFEKYSIPMTYLPVGVKNPQHSNYPTECKGPWNHTYHVFEQYLQKYLHTKNHCDFARFSNWARCKKMRWEKTISRQKFNNTKNDPNHFLHEFVLCD